MRGVSPNPSARAHSISLQQAERSGRPYLVFRDGDDREQLFVLPSDSSSVSVGRRSSSDLALPWDSQVSRSHAQFDREGESWVLVDDGLSSNGTFVNEERLAGRRRLSDGDTLRFGATTVSFHAPPRAEPPRPVPAEPPPAPPPPAPPPPARARPAPAAGLSTTQRRILTALCRPYKARSPYTQPATDDQIADELVLAAGEVRAHLKVLYAKLGITDESEQDRRYRLVERAFSDGLVSERDL
jgi:pSer/pThr/pTyr-binding forkhead associated (FHA) protein